VWFNSRTIEHEWVILLVEKGGLPMITRVVSLTIILVSQAVPHQADGQDGAHGPPVTEVEVVNEPLGITGVVDVNQPVEITGAVEVTNLPENEPMDVPRFQLVGFTSQTYDGNLGSAFGFTQKCQVEFPGSRWCSFDEARQTTSIPEGLSGRAWIFRSGTGRCDDWTSNDPEFFCRGGIFNAPPDPEGEHACRTDTSKGTCVGRGMTCEANGCCGAGSFVEKTASGDTVDATGGTSSRAFCDEAISLACCALVP